MLQLLNPLDLARVALDPVELARRWKDIGSRLKTATSGTAVFLTMGRDDANGRIELNKDGTPRIRWDVPSNLPLYEVQAAIAQDVAQELHGRYEANPAWTHLNQAATVHSLGGCRMADSPADGVVDPDGRVFGYPGLWVLDGSIIPTATGANPSHTITAVAERCIERAIRGITGKQDWVAPERRHAGPIALPEDVAAPVQATAPPRSQLVGLRFTETMKGTLVAHGNATSQTPLAARFKVTITSTDLAKLIADEAHPAVATGTITIDGYTGPEGAAITGGTFHLFTETDTPSRRKMLYSLPFVGTDGRRFVLQGNKEIWDHGGFDLWGSTTTLYSSLLLDEGDPTVPALATGILRLNLPMLARQATTVRITGTSNPLVQAEKLGGFLRFFGGTLTDVFVRPKVKA
jgi:cholesterol oxidase